jgi:hypothetical protein
MNREKCSGFNYRALIAIVCMMACASAAHAQRSSLSGVIIDEQTRKPIPFATVFFASTTFGTSAAEDGKYEIKNIPTGKYDVIISCVGYENFSYAIEFTGADLTYTFVLRPITVQLTEVVVDGAVNKKYYNTFLKFFLGSTPHSSDCIIENPEHLYFNYDVDKDILTAEATAPLVVINLGLGYRLTYILDEFMFDGKKQMFRVFGIPRFEDLPAKNDRQLKQWKRARDAAYYGSVNHFMRSLLARQLQQNHFFIQEAGKSELMNVDSLFKESTDQINFEGKLKIIYDGEKENPMYRRQFVRSYVNQVPQPIQTSIMSFTSPSVKIYDNGYFEDLKTVVLDGYLAWSESVAELVPLGYQPEEK